MRTMYCNKRKEDTVVCLPPLLSEGDNQWLPFSSGRISSRSSRIQAWQKVFSQKVCNFRQCLTHKYWEQTMTQSYDTFSHHHLDEFSNSIFYCFSFLFHTGDTLTNYTLFIQMHICSKNALTILRMLRTGKRGIFPENLSNFRVNLFRLITTLWVFFRPHSCLWFSPRAISCAWPLLGCLWRVVCQWGVERKIEWQKCVRKPLFTGVCGAFIFKVQASDFDQTSDCIF